MSSKKLIAPEENLSEGLDFPFSSLQHSPRRATRGEKMATPMMGLILFTAVSFFAARVFFGI